MAVYIYPLSGWPRFTWQQDQIAPLLNEIWYRQGRLSGKMESLGFNFQAEARMQTLTLDVLKSSEIGGEALNAEQVRSSSIARRLGMDIAGLAPADKHDEGIVEMMLDAAQQYL